MKTVNETDRQQLSEEPPASSRSYVSLRMFVGAAALAGAGLIGADANAQTRAEQVAGRMGNNSSDPGPENKTLLGENPSANNPPFTDHGKVHPCYRGEPAEALSQWDAPDSPILLVNERFSTTSGRILARSMPHQQAGPAPSFACTKTVAGKMPRQRIVSPTTRPWPALQ